MATAKPKSLPDNYKKTDVALMIQDQTRDGRWKAVMKDNTVWWYDADKQAWTKEGADAPQEQQGSDTTAQQNTVDAQARTAAGGGVPSEAGKEANLVNRQAKLADEGKTNQHPIDTGPGGHGAERTLSEADIRALEGKKAETPEQDAAVQALLKEKDDRIRDLEGRLEERDNIIRDKETKLAHKDVEIGALRAGKRGPNERRGDFIEKPFTAPTTMPKPIAGPNMPARTEDIPNVDEINYNNGQPERSPGPPTPDKRQHHLRKGE